MNRPKIAGIILSAGASRRMGTPKALLQFEGETFLDRLIGVFSRVANPVIVVLGHQADQIVSGIKRGHEAAFAINPNPERGMLSSLQCGFDLVPAESEGVMFTPVDHPSVKNSTLDKLVDHFFTARTPVAIPAYEGKHGHPVLIARPLVDEILALPVTARASDVIHRHQSPMSYVEVDDSGIIADINDPGAYAELIAHTGTT